VVAEAAASRLQKLARDNVPVKKKEQKEKDENRSQALLDGAADPWGYVR